MRQPVALDRIAERLDHRILPEQLRKGLRAIFAGEDAVWLGNGRRCSGCGHFCHCGRRSRLGRGFGSSEQRRLSGRLKLRRARFKFVLRFVTGHVGGFVHRH